MNEKNWKYCVVGNIVKTHYDKDGVLRYGTPAYTGGTKIYLCGKLWNCVRDTISVIGRTRGNKYQVHEVPPELIENIRCKRAYSPTVISIMNDWEFSDCWWGSTDEDKLATETFVAEWKKRFPKAEAKEGDSDEKTV